MYRSDGAAFYGSFCAVCDGTCSTCTANCIPALWKFHRACSESAHPWIIFHSPKRNVKYFQRCSSGNRTAENPGDHGGNRAGCGYHCGSGIAVYDKPGSLCTADCDGDLFYRCMRAE